MNTLSEFLPNLHNVKGEVQFSRELQWAIPDYTSPPLAAAIEATPKPFDDDSYMEQVRDMIDEDGTCKNDTMGCQILFHPPPEAIESGTVNIGVLFYGGALVDPRSYSVIAHTLSDTYGLPVSVPIFPNDIAFLGCGGTNRLPLAKSAFPFVEKWLLVGHSMGGIGGMTDLWNSQNETASDVGGLVLLGSYINQNGCKDVDFSQTNIPMASVFGELDGIINRTTYDMSLKFLPENDTFFMDVQGGNHGYFGHYNYTLRKSILNQFDGEALIPRGIQTDLSTGAIVHTASRMGISLPSFTRKPSSCDTTEKENETTSSASFSTKAMHTLGMIAIGLVGFFSL